MWDVESKHVKGSCHHPQLPTTGGENVFSFVQKCTKLFCVAAFILVAKTHTLLTNLQKLELTTSRRSACFHRGDPVKLLLDDSEVRS